MPHTMLVGMLELQILLAVEDRAPVDGSALQDHLINHAGRMALGSVYTSVYRLEAKGYLRSEVAPPTRKQGGRRKSVYFLTRAGQDALAHTLKVLNLLGANKERKK